MFPEKIGRYEIKRELGRGGMATVFQAFDPRFKRDVAIKVLPAAFMHEATFRARFEREAQIIAALEYPGIVPVYDFGEQDGQPYLVMRFMNGGSLSQKLKDAPLSLSETSQIFSRLAAALDYVHSKGIIHRDLKPANILFDQHANAYLSDFGIARIAEASIALTGDGLIGTPSYMSPEQARGDPDIDHRSDIYALGAILFEMLTGKQPYEATTPMGVAMKHLIEPVPRILEVKADLPPQCEDLITRAMAKDREKRFPNASEMARLLELISSQASTAQSFSTTMPVLQAAPPPITPVPAPSEPSAHPAVGSQPSHPSSAPAAIRPSAVIPASQAQVAPHSAPIPPLEGQVHPSTSLPPALARPQPTPPPPIPARPYPRKQQGWLLWLGISGLILIAIVVCGFIAVTGGLISLGALMEYSAPIDPGLKPTPIPGASPTEQLIEPAVPMPTIGVSIFQDDFSDPSSGWFEYNGNDGLIGYQNGYFRIFVNAVDSTLFSTPGLYYTDTTIEVEATKVGGADDNYFGTLCRAIDADNFYFFIISSDGYYAIGKIVEGQANLVGMDSMYYSEIIHLGQTTNYIRSDCIGNTLTLYVNGFKLIQVQDYDLSEGDVGLLAGTTPSNYGTDILFDNFVVAYP